jgi:hypothetical protein
MHRLGFEFNAAVSEFLLRLPNFDDCEELGICKFL